MFNKLFVSFQSYTLSRLSCFAVFQGVMTVCFPPLRTTSRELSPRTRAPAAPAAWTLPPAWRNESLASLWLPASLPTTGGPRLPHTHTHTIVQVSPCIAEFSMFSRFSYFIPVDHSSWYFFRKFHPHRIFLPWNMSEKKSCVGWDCNWIRICLSYFNPCGRMKWGKMSWWVWLSCFGFVIFAQEQQGSCG